MRMGYHSNLQGPLSVIGIGCGVMTGGNTLGNIVVDSLPIFTNGLLSPKGPLSSGRPISPDNPDDPDTDPSDSLVTEPFDPVGGLHEAKNASAPGTLSVRYTTSAPPIWLHLMSPSHTQASALGPSLLACKILP